MLKIKLYGEDVLRQKVEPIAEIDAGIRELARDMLETMYCADGIGLAAPQVGILQALVVVDVSPMSEKHPNPLVLINPKIVEHNGSSIYTEGCLSIPAVYADVTRPSEVVVRYQSLKGTWRKRKFDGIMARVIQHEIDHLKGVLFIDYLEEKTREHVMEALDLTIYDDLYDEAEIA